MLRIDDVTIRRLKLRAETQEYTQYLYVIGLIDKPAVFVILPSILVHQHVRECVGVSTKINRRMTKTKPATATHT